MLFEIMSGKYSGRELLLMILIMTLALTLSFSIHEFMHAAVATWLGDDTPGNMGRLTMNPAAHMDLMGTLCLLFIGFGWGKPVLYNPNRLTRFKSKRVMNILVALAGVTGNFILAFISALAMVLTQVLAGPSFMFSRGGIVLFTVLGYIYSFSLGLLAFNLLPIPPLDGFRVVEDLLPLKVKYSDGWKKFVYYGNRVLLVLILVGSMTGVHILSDIVNFIEIPFAGIINLIVGLILRLFV